jgi:flagellar basal-body rod protein FlgB
MEKLFGKAVNTLSDMADVRAQKHKVILSNVANIDTPGFKASELTFTQAIGTAKHLLQISLTQTDPAHLPGKAGRRSSVNYEIKASDESVKLDTEMSKLSENHLMFNTTMEILSRKFKGLQNTLNQTK